MKKRAKVTMPQLDFSLDALQGEPAEPSPAMLQAVTRAIEQIQGGASTVHLKGQTEHQCQVQLVPLLIEKAEAAGLDVTEAMPGRVGTCDVFFEPLYLARPRKIAARKPSRSCKPR